MRCRPSKTNKGAKMTCEFRQYASAQAAAARYARLCGELPGQVKAINYEKLAMACYGTDSDAAQERALEAVDEYQDLKLAFQRAAQRAGDAPFWAWGLVRIVGWSAKQACGSVCVSPSTLYRTLRRVDKFVERELVERDSLRGYGGRDLVEVPQEKRPRVEVWHNPGWRDDDGEV